MPNLRKIGLCGFYQSKLEYVDFPLLEEIDTHALSENQFTQLNFPNLRTVTGLCHVTQCHNLISFIAPQMENFSDLFFFGCKSLTMVVAPKALLKYRVFF